ncbi:hypothetical protein TNCV_3961251 [Trichonephila clavipes]|nr:hypothetical protein TNCV_3961251 [Trichonephila clavipes]
MILRNVRGIFYIIRLSYTVSSEWFVAIVDDTVRTDSIMTDNNILEFVQSSKNTIDTEFDEDNETNNAAPISKSFEMRNIMKKMHIYLEAHSIGERNEK